MRVLRTLTIDGDYVSARLHGHTVRVVVSSEPRALDVPIPAPPPLPIPVRGLDRREEAQAAARAPRRLGAERDAAQPPQRPQAQARARRLRRRPAHAALHRRRHADRGRRSTSRSACTKLDTDSVMTDADTVYASPTSLYVATSGGWQRDDTSIHRFDLAGDAEHRLPRERPGARRPAQPVRALRVQGRAARRDHRGVLGRQPEPRHLAAGARRPAREDRAGQRARARRAHLRGALHRATAATS